MIARIWHGAVPTEKSEEYSVLMQTVAIPEYRSLPGNHGAFVLRTIRGNTVHFLMLSFWESREAIARFAGENIEVAKYYDFDPDYLLELEPTVEHYDVYPAPRAVAER